MSYFSDPQSSESRLLCALRTQSGWWNGDARAREAIERYRRQIEEQLRHETNQTAKNHTAHAT